MPSTPRRHQGLTEKLERLNREALAEDEKQRRTVVNAGIDGEAKAKAEFASGSRKIATYFDAAHDTAKSEFATGKADAASTHDSSQKKAARKNAEKSKPIEDSASLADSIRNRLAILAADYKKFKLNPDPPAAVSESYEKFDDPSDELFTRLTRMDTPLQPAGITLDSQIHEGGPRILGLHPPGLGLRRVGHDGRPRDQRIGCGSGVRRHTRLPAAHLARQAFQDPARTPLHSAHAVARRCRRARRVLPRQARCRIQGRAQEDRRRRDEDLKRVEEHYRKTFAAAESRRDEQLRKINEIYADKMLEVQTTRERAMREAVDVHERRMTELKAMAETGFPKLEAKYKAYKGKIGSEYDSAWNALIAHWRDGLNQAAAQLAAIQHEVSGYCPEWNDPAWPSYALPKVVPPVIRFGTVPLELAALPGGVSAHAELMEGVPASFAFPALLPFPATSNLLIETPAEARGAALEVLQATMFRLLSSLPPGHIRFTIIDPIGIGRNFGAFMHLADYDGALVTTQVWTDPRQIEERLADLAAHMETVTQKYLRNEYATIEEYNAVAEEVAEPYRVLVVADFPAKFDEKSAARLAAIAAGGVPCGVLTLVAVDSSKPLPPGFQLDELRPYCAAPHMGSHHAGALSGTTLTSASILWRSMARRPLISPPATSRKSAPPPATPSGSRCRSNSSARPTETYWTRDSRGGIDVPLGKAGATKRQHFALGHGTSQHVLIAGRTGSGKSTLMHALIINLALNYSPDEIDLYLIDFKKGVEFKVYASYELPHASVVAIESEREFGISVLERLDAELRLRADRFRDRGRAGRQRLPQHARHALPCPASC